ncbi:hypothetical protein LUX12_03005 [Streptomyces somaliensis]|uniref:hypothetical protein n=1 Tax=Streptomyces somaliensis TaxID=78355 RepID=UPI0020CC5C46|nr:hypothetical protein [Streptomyces somaliensis]MCP9943998.1 hypothetical protein [Streptomyces somaliensis]
MVRRRVPLAALASALVLSGLWWWAVLRLALVPDRAGLVEGAAAAGGWGLSLLPVHVAAAPRPGGPAGRCSRWRAAVRDSIPEGLRNLVWDLTRAVGRGPPPRGPGGGGGRGD